MKSRRRLLGLSQAKLAERLGAAPTYIAMIEVQKKFPSVEMLERIAAALEVDAPELFSTQPLPASTLTHLQKTVLTDIGQAVEGIITKHLQEFPG
jgi:transcriptional regulator with XRE-family HTH domain